jgi:hypothetical protein
MVEKEAVQQARPGISEIRVSCGDPSRNPVANLRNRARERT